MPLRAPDPSGDERRLSGARARQRRAGREERCDDREAPAGNEVEAAMSPRGPVQSTEGEAGRSTTREQPAKIGGLLQRVGLSRFELLTSCV